MIGVSSSDKFVNIDLYKAGVFLKTLATNIYDNNTYTYTPEFNEEEDTDYSIRVTKIGLDLYVNTVNFEIKQTVLTALTPTSTDSYLSGQSFNITWSSNNVFDTRDVVLDLNFGGIFLINIATTSDDGTYSHSLPITYTFADSYSVTITKVGTVISDTTGTFELLPTTITITNPAGAEFYSPEDIINIVWYDNNIYDNSNVNIKLLLNGVFDSNIVLNTTDTNSYNYQIPIGKSNKYLIQYKSGESS